MPNVINRASLPQNFLQEVDTEMRLKQPQPQFFFARMAMAARLSTAALMAGAVNARAYATESTGGETLSPELDEMVRTTEFFPDAIMYADGFGLNRGDTMTFNRPVYGSGGLTKDARKVQGTKPTSIIGQGIKGEEAKLTLDEYEGPWDPAAGEVRPFEVREFDAKFLKNKENVKSLVGRNLHYDFTLWLDAVIRNEFAASRYVSFADGKTSVAGFTAGGGSAPDLGTVLGTRSQLSDRNRAPFSSGNYLLTVPTDFDQLILDDPAYRQLSAFKDAGRNHLYGYVATIQNVDIIQVANLNTYTAGTSVPGGNGAGGAATVPAGVTLKEALLIAPGALGFGVGQDPETRVSDSTDYGKMAKFIWNAKLAIGMLDDQSVQRFIYQAA